MTDYQALFRRALDAATPNREAIAAKLGLSSAALRRYRLGHRVPTPATAGKLARLLRAQAAVMVRLAEQLEATSDKEDTDAS
jgi:hypothetical protein